MATRVRIGKQLELSATPRSIIVTSATNEPTYYAPGADTTVLTMVSGVPTWAAPATGSSFTISDGTNNQVVNAGDTVTFFADQGLTRIVSATDSVTYGAFLSANAGNALVFGSDSGLYVPQAQLLTNATWTDSTNTLTLTFANGSTIDVPIVDVVGAFLSDFTISADAGGTDTINNHETLNLLGSPGLETIVTPNTVTFSLLVPTRELYGPLSSGTTVTLSQTPAYIVDLYRNGLHQKLGVGQDYTLSGTTVTFSVAFANSVGGSGGEDVEVLYHV